MWTIFAVWMLVSCVVGPAVGSVIAAGLGEQHEEKRQ